MDADIIDECVFVIVSVSVACSGVEVERKRTVQVEDITACQSSALIIALLAGLAQFRQSGN